MARNRWTWERRPSEPGAKPAPRKPHPTALWRQYRDATTDEVRVEARAKLQAIVENSDATTGARTTAARWLAAIVRHEDEQRDAERLRASMAEDDD